MSKIEYNPTENLIGFNKLNPNITNILKKYLML